MKPTRLNLQALRKNILPQSPRPREIEEIIAGHERSAISRRKLLALAGGGALVAAPAIASVRSVLASGFEIVTGPNRVALMLGGEERWAVDARRFAGRPKVSAEHTGRTVRIELRDARFPGTDIPADLTCEIRPGLVRRTIDIAMAFGGFKCSMPLEPWLLGAQPAQSKVAVERHAAEFSSDARLEIAGAAHARFGPDWCLDIDGAGVATFAGFGAPVVSDRAQIALADESESLLAGRNPRRTMLWMERGQRQWPIDPGRKDFGSWTFRWHGGAFDTLRAECAESRDGRRRAAVVAEGRGDGDLSAIPHGNLQDHDGKPFGLRLRSPRYAVAYDGDARHSALVANYGSAPEWMNTGGISVLLGDDEEERTFELAGENGRVDQQQASPAMKASFIPLGGGISRPATAPKGTRLDLLENAPKDLLSGDVRNYVAFDPNKPDETPTVLLTNAAAAMVRPEDLVVLIFQLEGMVVKPKVKPADGTATIERLTGQARIIVWFQPQNISEEAFFETAESYPVATGNANDPDKTNDGKDGTPGVPAPYAPPVQARLAGLSRLVFDVPSGVQSINCTLEELLKYCGEFDMHVAPHALPPKQSNWYAGAIDVGVGLGGGGTLKYAGNAYRKQLDVARGVTVPAGGATKALTMGKLSRSKQLIVQGRAGTLDKTRAKGLLNEIADVEIDNKINNYYGGLTQVRPPFRAPLPNETSIEAPYRLYISPNKFGAWAHALKPVYGARTGRAELWHTRLGVRASKGVDEADPRLRTIRAIWAADINPATPTVVPSHSNAPFRMTLDRFDRVNIANLSANYELTGEGGKTYLPLPIGVDRLMLSSLGAWMNVRGAWPRKTLPPGFSVEEWRHRGTMGRDHYVRVVYAGFLFPFGHYASLVKVTERKLQPHPGNPSVKVAFLRQRMFIVVREPEKSFRESNLVMKDLKTNVDGINIDLQMPFTSARITTLVTPNLDPPEDSDLFSKLQGAFWPRVNNSDFLFHMVLQDIGGNNMEVAMPLIFLGKEENDRNWATTQVDDIAAEYEKPANEDRRKRAANGQQVAFTESVKPGDTQFAADSLTFGVQVPQNAAYDGISISRPRFFPVVRAADLRLPVAKHLVANNEPASVRFAELFLKNGYGAGNAGQIFLEMLPGKEVNLDFNGRGDRSGGLVKPNMKISALSRMAGPIGGDNALQKFGAEGKFDPKDFFGSFAAGIPAKLFGVIDIWDIVSELGLDAGDLVPKFVTEALDAVEGFLADVETFLGYVNEIKKAGGAFATKIEALKTDIEQILAATSDLAQLPDRIDSFITHLNDLGSGYISIPKVADMQDTVRREAEKKLNQFLELVNSGAAFLTAVQNFVQAIENAREMKVKFEWKPALKSWGFDASHPLFIADNDGKTAHFVISVEARAKTDGNTEPSFSIICGLEHFTLDLIAPASFIKLYFNKVQFVALAGKKPEVDVDMARIEFVGVLSFVEALRSLIPLDGFSDPPGIDVTAEGITASFSVALPSIAFGVFSMQNMSLGAGFCIPFIGNPLSVNFFFCTRENPFILTVSMFGGGGYFGITIDPGGVQLLEAAFEFGASVALDFGVASGEIHAMGGFYFKLQGKDGSLTGYLRIGGSVDVLGLITASIELKLELTYEFASGKCVGRATLTIEIEILFFSASVEISCERKFAGSNGDPSFRQLMEPEGEWVPWNEYCEAFA